MFSSTAKTIEVAVHTLDGATMRVSLVQSKAHSHAQSIESILASGTPFLEFISSDGQRKFLAKHQIACVEPVEPLRKPALTPPGDPRFVDAFVLMGLDRNCTFEQAKDAYHRLAKSYHPDSYSGMGLPKEVERYLADMFKQINAAFTEVRGHLQQPANAGTN